jgi:hypothetical protein
LKARPAVGAVGLLYRISHAHRAVVELAGELSADLHQPECRCQLSARAVALIYNWWSLFVRLTHPQATGATRGHHQPAVVDVLGGAQDRACGPDDEHADRFARPFRSGAGSPDARLCLALRLGRPCCGAVEHHVRLATLLRSSQTPARRDQTASSTAISRRHVKESSNCGF